MYKISLIFVVLLLPFLLARVIEHQMETNKDGVPEYVLPVHNYIIQENGERLTFRDRDANEGDESLDRIPYTCPPEPEEQTAEKIGVLHAEKDIEERPWVFNDTTPFNGTEVEEELFHKHEFSLC